jgi:hypothetical protein
VDWEDKNDLRALVEAARSVLGADMSVHEIVQWIASELDLDVTSFQRRKPAHVVRAAEPSLNAAQIDLLSFDDLGRLNRSEVRSCLRLWNKAGEKTPRRYLLENAVYYMSRHESAAPTVAAAIKYHDQLLLERMEASGRSDAWLNDRIKQCVESSTQCQIELLQTIGLEVQIHSRRISYVDSVYTLRLISMPEALQRAAAIKQGAHTYGLAVTRGQRHD